MAITELEYIQREMDERDRRYDDKFDAEQKTDEIMSQQIDTLRQEVSRGITRTEFDAKMGELMTHMEDLHEGQDKDIANVAQHFSDKLAESQRLMWMIAGGAAVLASLVKYLNIRL